eukprot:362872-Chlamydomonas_euryale.AAC.2
MSHRPTKLQTPTGATPCDAGFKSHPGCPGVGIRATHLPRASVAILRPEPMLATGKANTLQPRRMWQQKKRFGATSTANEKQRLMDELVSADESSG